MVKTQQLSISINADNEGAVITINGESRYIDPDRYPTEAHLRNLLQDHPDYVYNAVIALLKEMAS